MTDYSDEDVQRVAKFVISMSNHEYYDDNSDSPPMFSCDLCFSNLMPLWNNGRCIKPNIKDFKHKPDCIYLVAQDLIINNS